MSDSHPSNRSHRPIRLLLDFDGTLTKTDTLAPLSQIGYSHHSHHSTTTTTSSPTSSPLIPWSSIVQSYLTDLTAHTNSYPYPPPQRTTLAAEAAWLNSLRPIERASAERAVEAGIWDGVTFAEVTEAAARAVQSGEVKCRPGWQECVRSVLDGAGGRGKGRVEVVSVNWSRAWIWSVLHAAMDLNPETKKGRDWLDTIPIFANELPSLIHNHTTTQSSLSIPGEVVELRTSGDKLRQLQLRQHHSFPLSRNTNTISTETEEENQEENYFTVYIGDSPTDLECLVAADLGICIRDEEMGSSQRELAETLQRVGVQVGWVGDVDWKGRGKESGPCVVWARGFDDVRTFLERLKLGGDVLGVGE